MMSFKEGLIRNPLSIRHESAWKGIDYGSRVSESISRFSIASHREKIIP